MRIPPWRTIGRYLAIAMLYALALWIVCLLTWWLAGHAHIF